MALPEPVFTSASVLAALSEDKHQTVTNIAKAVLRARGYTYAQYVQDISTERAINENLVTRMVDRTVVHILMTLERDGLVEESANRYRKVSAEQTDTVAEFLDLCADINVSPSVTTKQAGSHTLVTVKLSLEDLVAIVAAMR